MVILLIATIIVIVMDKESTRQQNVWAKKQTLNKNKIALS